MRQPLTAEDIEKATTVSFQLFQDKVDDMLKPTSSKEKSKNKRGSSQKKKQTNFASLSPFKKNGIWMTRGRFGKELGKVIGPSELPILPSTCVLARLLMKKAHRQAHHGGADTCFQSQSLAWIIHGRTFADKVSDE